MMVFRNLVLMAFVVSSSIANGTFDELSIKDERRRDEAVCDGIEEKLIYNIDIIIEDLGSDCGEGDLLAIGGVIQDVVRIIDQDVPEYQNERMDTLICTTPIKEVLRRRMQGMNAAWLKDANVTGSMRRRLASPERYRYRGGGKCRRCLTRTSDRRHLQAGAAAICEHANTAGRAVNIAAGAVTNAGEDFYALKVNAMECTDLRSGEETVLAAKKAWVRCKRAKVQAEIFAREAVSVCQTAQGASAGELDLLMRQAKAASSDTAKAASRAEKNHFQIRDELDELEDFICEQTIRNAPPIASVEGICNAASSSLYGVEIALTAFREEKDLLLELIDQSKNCAQLPSATSTIQDARATLIVGRQAFKEALSHAENARTQCREARRAASDTKLQQYYEEVAQSSQSALNVAETARQSFFRLRDDVDPGSVCQEPIEQSPSGQETQKDAEPQEFLPSLPDNENAVWKPLKQFLVTMAQRIYDDLPPALMDKYNAGAFGCEVDRFEIRLKIEVLERVDQLDFWVTQETCDAIASSV